MASQSASLTERKYVLPFVLVTSLFFLWSIGVNLNDVLIPHLKKAFDLTDFQSSFIQVAFFGGYFLAAFPAGRLMEKIGYKRGILVGLLICATGTLLFLPAASSRLYGFFLLALFVMSSGQSFLEVGANPYVTVLGPAESSERRLNFAQSFNAVGAALVPTLGAAFILSGIEYTPAQRAAMSPQQLQAYITSEANMVKVPYLVITGIFLLVAVMIYLAHLPEVQPHQKDDAVGDSRKSLSSIFSHPHLIKGVVAQFFYVGAQVGVGSFVIRFVKHTMPETLEDMAKWGTRFLAGNHGTQANFLVKMMPNTPEKMAALFLVAHQTGFMIGRFSGSWMMKRIAAPSGFRSGDRSGGLLQFHHVSDDFCAQPEKPRGSHEAGLVAPSYVNHWRSADSRGDGPDLRCEQHSSSLCHAPALLCLCDLFRAAGIYAKRRFDHTGIRCAS